jgi:flagellar basal-body rod protein FlgB
MQRLTSTLDFHAQALTLRAERQRLIASNIANADTPGYVARDMDFASALRQATGRRQWRAPWPQPIAPAPGCGRRRPRRG